MPKRRLRTTVPARVAVLVFAGISLAFMVWGLRTPPPLARGVLSDGSIITLEGVTYGHGPHYLHLGTHLQRWLGAHVHPEVGRFLHLERWGFTAYPYGQDPDRLLLWAKMRTPTPPLGHRGGDHHPLRPVLLDDDGIPYPDHIAETVPDTETWRKMFLWSVWPHRSRFLHVRVYDEDPKDAAAKPVLEWVIANPHPIQPPEWTTAALPIRSPAGPLQVTLNRLERVAVPPPEQAHTFPRNDGLVAAFHVTQDGKPAPDWRILEVLVEDPTGNTRTWGRPPEARYTVSNTGELLAEAANVVPPKETTIRLRVRLARKEDLQDRVTINHLPVSWDGPEVVPLNRTVRLCGRPVQLLQVSHTSQGLSFGYPFTLEYALRERPPIGVYPVKAVDSAGRPVDLRAMSWSSPDVGQLGLRPLPDAQFVDLTIRRSLDSVPVELCHEAVFSVAVPHAAHRP